MQSRQQVTVSFCVLKTEDKWACVVMQSQYTCGRKSQLHQHQHVQQHDTSGRTAVTTAPPAGWLSPPLHPQVETNHPQREQQHKAAPAAYPPGRCKTEEGGENVKKRGHGTEEPDRKTLSKNFHLHLHDW
jgi:hypothetical protein